MLQPRLGHTPKWPSTGFFPKAKSDKFLARYRDWRKCSRQAFTHGSSDNQQTLAMRSCNAGVCHPQFCVERSVAHATNLQVAQLDCFYT